MPDRVSLIFPPPKATPALVSAIRNAITSTSISNKQDKAAKIKLEGWVHDGVYRFWLDGMRRKIVGGVKKNAVER